MYGDETKKQFINSTFQNEQPVLAADFEEALQENSFHYDRSVPKADRVLREYAAVWADKIEVKPIYAERGFTGSREPQWLFSEETTFPNSQPDGFSVVGAIHYDDGSIEENADLAVFSNKRYANQFAKHAKAWAKKHN